MSDSKKSKKPAKQAIVDVQQPGQAAPSHTSRPVIVSNRPLLKDPMVVDDDKAAAKPSEQAEKPTETLPVASKPQLHPPETAPTPDNTPQPDAGSLPGDDTAVSPGESAPSENVASATNEPSAPEDPKNLAKQAEQAAAAKVQHDAAVQQLVDSKQYELPITTPQQRQNQRVVVLGVVLAAVLILIWLDIALDAGIIKLGGLHAPTHFFSN